MEVRRIRRGEGPRLKDARLRALLDAPTAFGSSHELEVARPDDAWEARAASSADGNTRAIWLAVDDEATHAMAGSGRLEDGRAGEHIIWGMWVAPEMRRRGLGDRLVTRCLDWSWQAGATVVTLWVVDQNTAARALYERAGFRPTDIRQPLPSHPILVETLMEQWRPEGK